jgi:23S rRNA (cytosine1962-C5)-methyltransferase
MLAVHLSRGDARLVRGHPWVFASQIARLDRGVQAGDPVEVRDPHDACLGWGFYSPTSRIAVRRLTLGRDERPFATLLRERLREALDLRRRARPAASCFRLVSSDADRLPGLVVDVYDDRLVLQLLTVGMDRAREEILLALDEVLAPRVVVERSDAGARALEGLEAVRHVVRGTDEDTRFEVELDSVRFAVDLSSGHKGGLYLDQRENHLRVARYAAGARVLDAFCYDGGFALHCAAAGASHVHAIEISAALAQLARANVERNGFERLVTVETANAFDALRAARPPYDLVILDPPSFTKSRASVDAAARGYKEIHLRACRLLGRGGRLATFCCSHHVGRDAFERIVVDAASDARRSLRRVESYGQPSDHPVLPAVPETEYLKGFLYEIVE